MHGERDEHGETYAVEPEHAFYELEHLFEQIAQKLQPFIDAEGNFGVAPGSVFNVIRIGMAMHMEIGGYLADARVLAVQITRRSSMQSVWAALRVPSRAGQGWLVAGFSLDEPPYWRDMAPERMLSIAPETRALTEAPSGHAALSGTEASQEKEL